MFAYVNENESENIFKPIDGFIFYFISTIKDAFCSVLLLRLEVKFSLCYMSPVRLSRICNPFDISYDTLC